MQNVCYNIYHAKADALSPAIFSPNRFRAYVRILEYFRPFYYILINLSYGFHALLLQPYYCSQQINKNNFRCIYAWNKL